MKQDPHRKPAQKHTHDLGLLSANAVCYNLQSLLVEVGVPKKSLFASTAACLQPCMELMQVDDVSRHAEMSLLSFDDCTGPQHTAGPSWRPSMRLGFNDKWSIALAQRGGISGCQVLVCEWLGTTERDSEQHRTC